MNYCYVQIMGQFNTWYVANWPSNTTLSTVYAYAKARGMTLYWDRDIRGLAMR